MTDEPEELVEIGDAQRRPGVTKTRQISITLPEDLIDTIRAAVERGEARSVSAYIASKLAPGVIMDGLFAEREAGRGNPSEVERWAGQELDRAFAEQVAHNRGVE